MPTTQKTKNKWKCQRISKHFKNKKRSNRWRHNNCRKKWKTQTRRKTRLNLKIKYNLNNIDSLVMRSTSIRNINLFVEDDYHNQKIDELMDQYKHLYHNKAHCYQIGSKYYGRGTCFCSRCLPSWWSDDRLYEYLMQQSTKRLHEFKTIISNNFLVNYHQMNYGQNNQLLIDGYIRKCTTYDKIPTDLIMLCFNYLFIRIKLVLIDSRMGGKVDFNKFIFLSLPTNYPIIALYWAIRNDFGINSDKSHYAGGCRFRLLFNYASAIGGDSSKMRENKDKWIKLDCAMEEYIKIDDIRVDRFGKNLCTILLDLDQRIFNIDKHDYWLSRLVFPDRDWYNEYLDTSGEYLVFRRDSTLKYKRYKITKKDRMTRESIVIHEGIRDLLSLGIEPSDLI